MRNLLKSRLISRRAAGCAHGQIEALNERVRQLEEELVNTETAHTRACVEHEQQSRVQGAIIADALKQLVKLTAENQALKTPGKIAENSTGPDFFTTSINRDGDELLCRTIGYGQPERLVVCASLNQVKENAKEQATPMLHALEEIAIAHRSGVASERFIRFWLMRAEAVLSEVYVPLSGKPAGAIHFNLRQAPPAPEVKQQVSKKLPKPRWQSGNQPRQDGQVAA